MKLVLEWLDSIPFDEISARKYFLATKSCTDKSVLLKTRKKVAALNPRASEEQPWFSAGFRTDCIQAAIDLWSQTSEQSCSKLELEKLHLHSKIQSKFLDAVNKRMTALGLQNPDLWRNLEDNPKQSWLEISVTILAHLQLESFNATEHPFMRFYRSLNFEILELRFMKDQAEAWGIVEVQPLLDLAHYKVSESLKLLEDRMGIAMQNFLETDLNQEILKSALKPTSYQENLEILQSTAENFFNQLKPPGMLYNDPLIDQNSPLGSALWKFILTIESAFAELKDQFHHQPNYDRYWESASDSAFSEWRFPKLVLESMMCTLEGLVSAYKNVAKELIANHKRPNPNLVLTVALTLVHLANRKPLRQNGFSTFSGGMTMEAINSQPHSFNLTLGSVSQPNPLNDERRRLVYQLCLQLIQQVTNSESELLDRYNVRRLEAFLRQQVEQVSQMHSQGRAFSRELLTARSQSQGRLLVNR